MPINKFGTHFLDNNQITQPFYVCEPASFHSTCFIRLRGSQQNSKNKDYYILDNQGTAFVFPFSGKIRTVRHYQADGDVIINSVSYKYHQLAGISIQTGDKVEFRLGTPDIMCADFVLDCPLEKNV